MFRGKCLCGGVSYEIASLDGDIVNCHCVTCRKAHASAFTSTARVAKENFRVLRGEDLLRNYESSPGKIRRFCSVCGSHVVAERSGQPHVVLRVATLDDDPGKQPVMSIWMSHEVKWVSPSDDIPRFPEGAVANPR